MRIGALDLRDLLKFRPAGGILQFAGQRAVILDTVALGLLRKELIDTVGFTAGRGILTRFGYAHGWRTADGLETEFPWDNEEQWRLAGGKLHTLQGLLVFEPVSEETNEDPDALAAAIWHDSYEAEQHLLHFGLADEAVCWTLCGFAAGYLTRCHGEEIYCFEKRCRGRGDSVCQMVGKTRRAWGGALEPHLAFYRKDSLQDTLEELNVLLRRTERRLRSRRRELSRAAPGDGHASGIADRSEPMKRVVDMARRVAKFDSPLLITGETGVGKKTLARLIHDESARSGRPLVTVNCALRPERFLESELFGHGPGALGQRTKERMGLLEAAHGGTVLLNEIAELPAGVQAQLLSVLEDGTLHRVGETQSRPVDVRMIAVSRDDLGERVAHGRLREDLYYRLRVVELAVPPLRERKDDILTLARIFLAQSARRLGRRVNGFSPRAAAQLWSHDWPGNVRELENAIERAVMLAENEPIEIADLPHEVRAAGPPVFTPGRIRPLGEVERDYILTVLDENRGNQTQTALQLGIGTATLYRKLKKYKAR